MWNMTFDIRKKFGISLHAFLIFWHDLWPKSKQTRSTYELLTSSRTLYKYYGKETLQIFVFIYLFSQILHTVLSSHHWISNEKEAFFLSRTFKLWKNLPNDAISAYSVEFFNKVLKMNPCFLLYWITTYCNLDYIYIFHFFAFI